MTKRKTNEEFQEEFSKIDSGIDVIGEYVDSKHKIAVRCRQCGHEWEMLPGNILHGQGCMKCRSKKWAVELGGRRKKSQEQFASEVEAVNPDIEVVGRYVKASQKVEVRCKKCGNQWSAFPTNLLKGVRCQACSHRSKVIPESVARERLAKVHKDVELVGEYTMVSKRALFRCSVCGHEWRAVVTSVLAGNGCPACVPRKISEKATISNEEFLERASKNSPTVQVLGTYTKSVDKIEVRCEVCGYEWTPQAGHIMNGDTGCPRCAGNLRHTQEEFTEIVKEKNPNIDVVGKYVNVKSPIAVRCKTCGNEWSPSAGSLIAGNGCIVCSKTQKLSNEEFVERLTKANPFVEAIDEYVSMDTSIRFKCRRCGETWTARPYGPLHGTQCPSCSLGRRGFFEHALLFAARSALGDDKVLSRDRETIGLELDVYIPSMNLAFEPGSWFYHSSRESADLTKYVKCNMHGIELVTILLGYPDDLEPPNGYLTTNLNLGVEQWDSAKEMIVKLLSDHGIDTSNIDWEQVRLKAIEFTGRRTTEMYKEELSKVNENIEVLGEYVTARSKIKVRCKVCGHTWSPVADSLLRGTGCKVCSARARGMASRKDHDTFVKEVAEMTPNVEVIGQYQGWDSRVLVRCKECGREWSPMAGTLLHGHGCAKCAGNQRKSPEEFIEQLAKVNKTITPLEEYVAGDVKIGFHCDVCGNEWRTTPSIVLSGRGCPECGKVKSGLSRRRTHDEFVAELAVKNPTIIPVGCYHLVTEKMAFMCADCGEEFEATPDNMLRGKGCPRCRYKKAAETRRRNALAKKQASCSQ